MLQEAEEPSEFDLNAKVQDEEQHDERPPPTGTIDARVQSPALPLALPTVHFDGEGPVILRSNTDPAGFLSVAPEPLDPLESEVDGKGAELENPSPSPMALSRESLEVPIATALEIIQAVKPEETSLEYGEALSALDTYTKGQTADTHAQQQFRANLHAAFRVGWWTVLLSLPIIAWPVAAWLQETGKMENEYLGYWGSMLLQFLFCVGPTLGASVKYGLDGLLGTVLAWANMLLLNNITGDWMSGGAYTDRIEFFDNTTQSLVVTSKWFPLCGNGKDLSYNNCILNVNADLGHEAQFGKAAVVLLDFVIFVFLILFLGFNTNVRTFSISTHVYFAMTFLNPVTGSFDISPSLATNYLGIVVCSSLALWICFLFPAPITSRARARALLETTGSAVAMLLEALPLTPSELCRAKAQAAVEEMATLMKDLDFHLAMMWFEDFGILQRRARYRRWLQSYAEVLKASIRNCDAVLCAAAALPLKESEQLAALLPSLRHECVLLASTLRALLAVKTPDEVKPVVQVLLEKRQALREQLSGEFEKGQRAENLLLPPGLVFVLAVTGVLQDTCEALSSLTLYDSEEQRRSCCQRIARYVASMQSHMEFKLYERSITHPRFVLRHTISLTLTFIIGWLGVSNVIAPYSSQPAVVVSVIIYTYTGSSIPLTLKRLNGVVLGNVMGSMAQRLFAVQTVGHATCFAIFQLVTVTLLIFLAFHSKQHGGVALLTAAYAMSTAMPVDGMFREREVKLTDSDGSFLFSKVTGTFIGVAVLLLVDFLLGSSARRQAKQRLLRSVGRVSAFIGQVLDPADQQRDDVEKGEEDDAADVAAKLQAGIYDDLDELVALLTYASDEPSFDGRPFPTDLFKNLEKGLRIIARHFRIVQWAIQILEKPQKRMVLRAGSRIFKALTPSAKAEPVLRTELFRPILATLASEMQLMLENIRVIASGMVWSQPWSAKQERQDAERVKELLRNKLYTKTVSNAFCRIARSPWRTAWKVARAEQESTNVATVRVGLEHLGLDDLISPSPLLPDEDFQSHPSPSTRLRRSASNPLLEDPVTASPSRAKALLNVTKTGAEKIRKQKRALQKFAHQLRKESLEEEAPVIHLPLPPVTSLEKGGAKEGVADSFALRLLLIFDRLREAAAMRRNNLPESDAMSTLELMIFFLGSVQTQIQHMQVNLLEYS